MVNFDNETTITTAPQDIVKILILERRKYVCDAIEHYYKIRANNIEGGISIVKSRMIALFLEIQAGLKRDLPNEYEEYEDIIFNSDDINELIGVYGKLNDWFDNKRLIRIDTIKSYDSTRVETENKEKGL